MSNQRTCRYGIRPPATLESAIERFWSKVEKTDACWLWTGTVVKTYGQFSWNNKPWLAHRFAYEQFVGPIPAGMHVDHVLARGCTSRLCVRPDHLEAVTPAENNRRRPGPIPVRKPKDFCAQGHPMAAENLYVNPNTGRRYCRTCHQGYARNRKLAA